MWRILAICIVLGLTAAGCRTGPKMGYAPGDILLQEDFSAGFAWDTLATNNVQIGVKNGVYAMRSDVREYVRGFNNQVHENVIVEADSQQLSSDVTNAYGLICRGSPDDNGSGYYFLISADGTYSIRRGRGGEIESLVSWTPSGAINKGMGKNTLRAICVDDYLALYVNGQFVADTRDTTYKRGYTGFAVAVSRGGTVEIAFDNLIIREGSLLGLRS